MNREPRSGARPPSPPMFNAPRVILLLCAVMIGIHALRAILPANLNQEILFYGAVIPARYWGDQSATLLGLIGPLFTYAFLHADVMHVGLNSIWLLALGTPVARRLSLGRFFGLFFAASIVGAVVHILMYGPSNGALIGASGAIAGLMGAAVRFALFVPGGYAAAFKYGFNGGLVLPLQDPRVLKFSAVWIVFNLVFGLFGGIIMGGGQLIAWDVHIVGYLSGLLLFPRFDAMPQPPRGGGSDKRRGSHLRRVK